LEAVTSEQIRRATAGDRQALEAVVRGVQDSVYGLALRMLWHPEDAKDATQEILIKAITHLDSFRGDSAFSTWIYRIAANHLSNVKKSRLERQRYTFERFGAELEQDQDEAFAANEPSFEEQVLIEELKVGCTLAMLTCLDRPHRLAYILGEILELPHDEGAAVLEIGEAAFRKRLSRARSEIVEFTRRRCGLVDPANRCQCRKHVPSAIASGLINPGHEQFADRSTLAARQSVGIEVIRLEEMRRLAAVYRSHPQMRSPDDLSVAIRRLTEAVG
jgi:RNA polymerase sigma factor (sigma-70 family)